MKKNTVLNLFKVFLCLIITSGLVALDRISKIWAVRTLKGAEDIILIRNVFQLHYLENRGMAFGMMQNQQIFFYIITVVILAVAMYFLVKTPAKKRYLPLLTVIVLIIAGAIGNLIDRASQKFVVDFLYFSLIDFPIFNVADCYVTVGCFSVIIMMFFYKDEELSELYSLKKKALAAEETGDGKAAEVTGDNKTASESEETKAASESDTDNEDKNDGTASR